MAMAPLVSKNFSTQIQLKIKSLIWLLSFLTSKSVKILGLQFFRLQHFRDGDGWVSKAELLEASDTLTMEQVRLVMMLMNTMHNGKVYQWWAANNLHKLAIILLFGNFLLSISPSKHNQFKIRESTMIYLSLPKS